MHVGIFTVNVMVHKHIRAEKSKKGVPAIRVISCCSDRCSDRDKYKITRGN